MVTMDSIPEKMLGDEHGVSVIIGAMLLILITVVAAASLAVIISQAQKQQADIQAHQAAVENEKLVITGIDPEINSADSSLVNSLFITVQNLNIDLSRLMTIYVNDKPCFNYSLVSVDGIKKDWKDNWLYNYNMSNRYDIPGRSTAVFNLNLTKILDGNVPWDFIEGVPVHTDKSITIKIMTSYINTFDKTFNNPNAVAQVKVLSQDVGSIKRDYLYLDGSESTSESQLVHWQWNIYDESIGNISTQNGSVVSLNPRSTGGFRINLTVTDTNDLIDTSEDIIIPKEEAFDPLAHIIPVQNGKNVTLITTRMSNATISDVYINLEPKQGNLELDKYYGKTDSNGTFGFTVKSGNGTITVVADCDAGSLTKTIVIAEAGPQAPEASFVANVTSGDSPLMVQFNDTSTNIPTSWEWNFGDGSPNSTDRNVAHTFINILSAEKVFTVTLTATNSAGSSTTQINVTVRPMPPVANFTANVTSGVEPLVVSFTDHSTNGQYWFWTFGDGDTSDEINPSHTFYYRPDPYNVTLTVSKDGLGSDLTYMYITVNVTEPEGT
jgi:FOG: PKD repeat